MASGRRGVVAVAIFTLSRNASYRSVPFVVASATATTPLLPDAIYQSAFLDNVKIPILVHWDILLPRLLPDQQQFIYVHILNELLLIREQAREENIPMYKYWYFYIVQECKL
jgi:hypothetical protein